MRTAHLLLNVCIVATLSSCGCSHDTRRSQGLQKSYRNLVDPSEDVRLRAKTQLLATSSESILHNVRELLLSSKAGDEEIAEASLLLLHEKEPEQLHNLLASLGEVKSPRLRGTVLGLVRESDSAANEALIKPFLDDSNIVVRVRAANLLKSTGYFDDVFRCAVDSLSYDETETLGDPPMPAFILGKQVLVSMPDTERVIKALNNLHPKEERTKYHIQDVKLFLAGKTKSMVYNHVGPPSERDKRILSSD